MSLGTDDGLRRPGDEPLQRLARVGIHGPEVIAPPSDAASARALIPLTGQDGTLEPATRKLTSELRYLLQADNAFTTLPADVFSGLTVLQELTLERNRLVVLPDGLFAGVSELRVPRMRISRRCCAGRTCCARRTASDFVNLPELPKNADWLAAVACNTV